MKKLMLVTVALVVTTPAFAGNTPVDFNKYFGAVSCIGESEVWYRDPVYAADGGLEFPDKEPVNVTITPNQDGWKVTGSYGLQIKRWKRTTSNGYPIGSAVGQ
jgi:hypothetical protein